MAGRVPSPIAAGGFRLSLRARAPRDPRDRGRTSAGSRSRWTPPPPPRRSRSRSGRCGSRRTWWCRPSVPRRAGPGHEDRSPAGGDRAPRLRAGDAGPAEADALGDPVLGDRHRRRLRVLLPARHPADPGQHDPRRRPPERGRGLHPLLRGLRRARGLARQHPGPAGRGHVERGLGRVRGLGQLRERRPRRSPRARRPRSPPALSGPTGPRWAVRRGASARASRSTAACSSAGPTASASTRGSTSTRVFFGARRQGDRSIFKLFGFSGREKTRAGLPGRGQGHARVRPAREPALPRRARPIRPGLRAGAVDEGAGALLHPGPSGLLQRRPGLLPPPGRSGHRPALAVQPRLALRGRVHDLQPRARRARFHRQAFT